MCRTPLDPNSPLSNRDQQDPSCRVRAWLELIVDWEVPPSGSVSGSWKSTEEYSLSKQRKLENEGVTLGSILEWLGLLCQNNGVGREQVGF